MISVNGYMGSIYLRLEMGKQQQHHVHSIKWPVLLIVPLQRKLQGVQPVVCQVTCVNLVLHLLLLSPC